MITIFIYLLFFGFLGVNAEIFGAEGEDSPLELVALLIKNQNYSRAAGVLNQIKDPHEVIPERYFALKGILELKQKRYKEALVNFKSAEKESLKSSDLYEGMAECYLGLNQPTEGIKLLKENKKALSQKPYYFQLLSSLYFMNTELEKGWSHLNLGLEKFPKHLDLHKQKWFYLMENKLFNVSFKVATHMVDHFSLTALDIARMGQKYRQNSEAEKAVLFGEMALLIDPTHEEIVKDLARSYLKKENYMSAARLFSGLAKKQPKFLVEASELWRKAGYPMHAERLALEIRDPQKKLKQTITLALLNEDFNRMSSYADESLRSDLKNDQDIQYALAYAQFMLGDFKGAAKHLNFIQRADLFKKAVALKEAMASCETGDVVCL